MNEDQAREAVRSLSIRLPRAGDLWWWEPEEPHARRLLAVTDVRWNGEEWWVYSTDVVLDDGAVWPNELDRWHEATVLHRAA